MNVTTDILTKLDIADCFEFEAWQVAFGIFAIGTLLQFAGVVAACEWDWRRGSKVKG